MIMNINTLLDKIEKVFGEQLRDLNERLTKLEEKVNSEQNASNNS